MTETISRLSGSRAVERVFSKYFVFRGRATRSEYWYFVLFLGLINLLISAVAPLIDPKSETGLAAFVFVVELVLLVPYIAVTVRRLHDTNRSGWWLFIWLIPVLGPVVLLVFTLQKSDIKANRFGPAPLRAAW